MVLVWSNCIEVDLLIHNWFACMCIPEDDVT